MKNNLDCLVPRPSSIVPRKGSLSAGSFKTISVSHKLLPFGQRLASAFQYYGVSLKVVTSKTGSIRLELDKSMSAEEWSIRITSSSLRISAGGRAGIMYAVGAMHQLLSVAFSRGREKAVLPCGEIKDRPRFEWRGFMLDSARHFQPTEKIKEVIRLMANFRLNVLHWHLTDSQGWRIKSSLVRRLSSLADLSEGQYTRAELAEIAAYAAEHSVRIVPEIDMPGHSGGLLRHYPRYACDPANPGGEFCLGKRPVRTFLKKILEEVAGIFPDSPVIHIGGDEASTHRWKKCPDCQTALRKNGLKNERELENQFMLDMTRHIVELGRRPMVWCTESLFPPDTIIQAWRSLMDVSESVENGNQLVNSVHYNLYFDYPENHCDPHPSWMPALPPQNVYMAEPNFNTPDNLMLGVEACLWTEIVPPWRVIPKMLSRLWALSETAWTEPDRKSWSDFTRRKAQLEASGYPDMLCRFAHKRKDDQ